LWRSFSLSLCIPFRSAASLHGYGIYRLTEQGGAALHERAAQLQRSAMAASERLVDRGRFGPSAAPS